MKRVTLVLAILLLSCTLIGSHSPPERIPPDTGQRFRIWQSFISSHPDGRDATLRVFLCTDDTEDLEQIFEEIRAFHDNMNGADDELTIHLFRSKIDLENSIELGSKTYYKGE